METITKMSVNVDEIKSRARAAFIGMAIGDALGATVEFMTASEIASKYGTFRDIIGGGWLRLKPGQVTDDTEMALCIARAIIDSGGWSTTAIAENFGKWLRSHPVDCGDTCRKGIRNYLLNGTCQVPYNHWDAGNGAAMRVLPAAIYSFPEDGLLKKYAIEQARITHNNPLSDAACLTLGRMIHLAMNGKGKLVLRREVDRLIEQFPGFSFEPYRKLATGYVVDTLQTVFHWFFRGKSFEECLVGTVNQGGDADTTGAICGMLAGAYYGIESIPPRWYRKMDQRVIKEIEQLSVGLLESGRIRTM